MILYFLIITITTWITWIIYKELTRDVAYNYSKTSVPLVKTAFKLAFMDNEKLFATRQKLSDVLKKSYHNLFFNIYVYVVIRARDAEKVLGSSKHIDKNYFYIFLRPFLKTGLLTSNGAKWHKRRRILTPTFHFEILKEFFEVFKEEGDKLITSLKKDVGKELIIAPISSKVTLNTICETALGMKLDELGDDGVLYRKRIGDIGQLFIRRIMRPWLYPEILFILLGGQRQYDVFLKPVYELTKKIIGQRKAAFKLMSSKPPAAEDSENIYSGGKKRRYAMMDTLLQAQQQGAIDDEGIIEETNTFTFEGHDTTSAAMTYTLFLLAHNPEAQKKIFEEIQEISYETDKDEPTIDDINKMDYLDRVIKESLRIYPPVPLIAREFTENFIHDGVLHKKGDSCVIFIYDIHRDPEVFPDPEKFDPDRFLPENSVNRSNFAFIAFSAGMRNCIGQKFAMLELKVILTKIIKSFEILPVTTREEVTFLADFVLRSKNPIKVKFELRK